MLHSPLGPCSGNIRWGLELTPYARGKIISAAKCGKTPAEIALSQNLAHSMVKSTLQLDLQCNEGVLKPQTGQPKVYTECEE